MTLLLILRLRHIARHNVAQARAVKEGAGVFQDVLGAIIKNLADEQLQKTVDFRVLSEVPLIRHPQLQLLLLNFVLLGPQDALHADQVVVVFENIIPLRRVLNLVTILRLIHLLLIHAVLRLLLHGILLIRHLCFWVLFYKIIIIYSPDYLLLI